MRRAVVTSPRSAPRRGLYEGESVPVSDRAPPALDPVALATVAVLIDDRAALTVRCLDAQRSAAPIDLPVDDAYDLALGYNHLCVLRSDGSVWCSGDNNLGQLGSGDTVGSAALRRVVF